MGCKPEVTLVHFDETRVNGADPQRPYFVEMWDIGGHHEWKNLRHVYYEGLDGVVLVHDLTRKRTLRRLTRWAREIAARASFASPTPAGSERDARDAMVNAVGGKLLGDALDGCVAHGFGGLPCPALFVGNKADIVNLKSARDGEDASDPGEILSALLWRAWCVIAAKLRLPNAWRGDESGGEEGKSPKHVRRGSFASLLPTVTQELRRVSSGVFDIDDTTQPDTPPSASNAGSQTSTAPPGGGLRCSATRGDVDMTVVEAYFKELIRRRHYHEKAKGASGGTVWQDAGGGGAIPASAWGDGAGAVFRGGAGGVPTAPPQPRWMGGDRLDAHDLT